MNRDRDTDMTPRIGRGRPSTPPTHGATCGASLLRDIQSLCFAKTEVTLYLDTHPDNKAALDYFYDICDKLEALTERYEAECGPLTACSVQGTSWHWIDGPWPWQNAGEMTDGGIDCRGNKREG